MLRAAGFGNDEADVFHNPAFVPGSDGRSSISCTKSGVVSASTATRIKVRPKRGSFAAVAQAGKQAQQSIFQSAAKTATLSAGTVSQDGVTSCQ